MPVELKESGSAVVSPETVEAEEAGDDVEEARVHDPKNLLLDDDCHCCARFNSGAERRLPRARRAAHAAVVAGGALTLGALLAAFSLTACSDPGIVYRELGSDDVARRFCSRCDFERPIEARHCYDCDLCVRDLDHHCPWTGKCIGAKTIRNFYAFLVCLLVHLVYVVVMTVSFFVRP
ncbi:DHHC palmitoyltransferase [Aureococcus anophagefferens]|nr:DHHC palmitoyltransferase [Aureococcus anophagefferens]